MKTPELDSALGAVRSNTWLDSECITAAASSDAVASQRRHGCDDSSPAPYYEDSAVTIYHGDCRVLLPLMSKVESVITDPPYGMGKSFANDTPEESDPLVSLAMELCRRITSGNIISFWSAQRMDVIQALFRPKRLMVWNKKWAIHAPNGVGYRYEPIVWVSGKNANGKRGDVFECFPIIREVQEESVGHPTQKPEQLMRDLVDAFGGATVLDPFMGSGTTLRAAKDMGRKAIGIEVSERYCEIAAKRMAQEVLNFTPAVAAHPATLTDEERGSRNTTAQESN